jgi:hypothetical protein
MANPPVPRLWRGKERRGKERSKAADLKVWRYTSFKIRFKGCRPEGLALRKI